MVARRLDAAALAVVLGAVVFATTMVVGKAWAYSPCIELKSAVEHMARDNDGRLAEYRQRLTDCEEAARRAQPPGSAPGRVNR